MLRDTLFSLLSQRLGNRADLVSRMSTEVQLLQEVVLEKHAWLPWFLETEMASTVTVLGEARIQLPDDFLSELEEQSLWIYDSTLENPYLGLDKKDFDDMIVRFPGTGKPRAYALGADYFYLGPAPDDEYPLKMRYYAMDTVLDSNIENKWLKHASDVVLAELGIVMAEKHMQHFELAQTFRKDAEVAWNRLYASHIARQEVNRSRVMEA